MASVATEREVEAFVASCPLRRSSLCDRVRIVKTAGHYNRLWAKELRDIEEHKEQEALETRRNRMVAAFRG